LYEILLYALFGYGEISMGYPTVHEYFKDNKLDASRYLMEGKVLDIGGKKANKSGGFIPHSERVLSWEYVNVDRKTEPDYLVDAAEVPINDNSIDCILLCETLEHVVNPIEVLGEAYRLLKNDGVIIITMPFMFPVHAEPSDFQRWTDRKIDLELSMIGFSNIRIEPMGGSLALLYDIVRNELRCRIKRGGYSAKIIYKILLKILRIFYRPTIFLDKKIKCTKMEATTGWFVVCSKPQ